MDSVAEYIRVDDGAALSFAAATLLCGYLMLRCITPPNKTPDEAWKKDGLAFFGNTAIITLIAAAVMPVYLYHALLAVVTPAALPRVCPNPAMLNESLLRWNALTASCVAAMVLLAPLRLGAYKNLGKNFTYGLAAPSGLITDGIYAYVQHPSYTGIVAVLLATHGMFGRWDSAVACLLPEAVVQAIASVPHAATYASVAVLAFASLQMYTRVSQEEAMLRELFGKEWEAWHAKTARFIPGIL